MKTRHFTIPIFVPDLACPFTCIFCNQKKISGVQDVPEPVDVKTIIEKHLQTIPKNGSEIELGFFGGSFTGLPLQIQENYLKQVAPYLEQRVIKGIRLSTRPDFINKEILALLKSFGVSTIELGAQSFDDEVLKASGRGHTSKQIVKASEMIVSSGFRLGLQMMTGLPGDSLDKTINTAERIVKSGATETRIYPVLVIKETALELMYSQGKYSPLSLEEAVFRCAEVFRIFEKSNITILRMGLHPSEGLIDKTSLIAGPFHVSFKELVLTELWRQELERYTETNISEKIAITVAENQIKHAIGYNSSNRKMLEKKHKRVDFIGSSELNGRNFYADHN
jgi:histone acetyltransferase (RNA polymerase elongator complex component)